MHTDLPKKESLGSSVKIKKRGLFSKRTDLDLTSGPLFSSMIAYALPLLAANLISTLFSAMDLMALSYFSVGNEVAAVGATSALTALFLNLAYGLTTGITVILARSFGERNRERVQSVISTAIIAAVVIGVTFAVIGALLVPSFLRWTNCPADCIKDATLYAVIYILGMPFYLLYGYLAAVIRVSGDSERPLYYMLAGGVMNVVLNFLLCVLLPHKVLAVAIATLASNVLGAFLCLRRLATAQGIERWDVKQTRFDPSAFASILRYGIPVALTNVLFPIANLQIQSAINAFGSSAVAGNTACSQYEGLIYSCMAAFLSAAMAFMGQNIGAKKPERVFRSFFYTQGMATAVTVILSLFVILFGKQLLPIFSGSDPAAVEFGLVRVRVVIPALVLSFTVFATTIQVFGYPALQTASEVIGIFVLRTVWLQFIYGTYVPATPKMLYLCFPITIAVTAIINGSIATVLLLRYRKGKYKQNV
jgi:putative MATE family efflux protein